MNDIDADDVELTPVFVGMPSIATDRPDITESAQITPVGWFQYEGGYQFSHAEERISLTSISDAHQIEQVLRFGINRKFEMRAVINSNTQRIDIVDTWNDPFRTTGVNPVTIGFKYNLFKETDLLPQTTWLSHLTLPWVAAGLPRSSPRKCGLPRTATHAGKGIDSTAWYCKQYWNFWRHERH